MASAGTLSNYKPWPPKIVSKYIAIEFSVVKYVILAGNENIELFNDILVHLLGWGVTI